MTIARLAVRHRAAVFLATALVTIAGAVAVNRLPSGIYPEAEFARVIVVANGGTFDPRDMIVAVTRPMEEALIGVIDLRRLRTRTVRGATEIAMDFKPRTDMQYALQQVQARLATLQPTLPAGLEFEVERLTPSVFPMLQFELTGADPTLLRDLAQYTVRPRLARLPDVGNVNVQGGLVREISVEVDPGRLEANRIGVAEVADRIRGASSVTAAGRIEREYRQFSVLVSSLASNPEDVGNLVIKQEGGHPLRVKELATVRYGSEDLFQLASGNGRAAALIDLSRQPGGDMLRVEAAVLATVDTIQKTLPAGVRLETVYDLGRLVRQSIGGVRDAMLIGGGLAIVTLLLFLGRPMLTAVAALTLPLAMIGTFAGLALFHDSLNLMSLGGLAVAVGLIIDDAVVVVENIERRLSARRAEPPSLVVEQATEEILPPVAGSTLTTVVVFAPLGFLDGVVGEFFRSFSLALTIAVLLSLVCSVTVIPTLIAWLERRASGQGARPAPRFQIRLTGLERWYRQAAGGAQQRRGLIVAIAVAMALGSIVLYRSIGTGFLPDMDEGGFILDYWTPTGASLAETDREVRQVERVLGSDSAIAAYTRRTGAELGLFATAPNRGDMTVLLKPQGARDASVFEVMERIRLQIGRQLPSVRVEFHQVQADLLGDLTGAGDPIEIKVFHPDVRTAEVAAAQIAEAIESVPALDDLFNGVQGDLPEMTVRLDPVRVANLGLTPEEAGAQARAALFGAPAGAVREPDRLVPIRVRLPDSLRLDPAALSRLPIVGSLAGTVLANLGVVHDTAEVSELTRDNLRSMVAVTGAVDVTTGSLGGVMRAIRSKVAGIELPPGAYLEFGGQEAPQQESFRQLLLVLAIAVGAVLLVMVIQFSSMSGPIMILAGSLLGLTGAIAALAITGIPFNVSSFMGLILLVGLVVKNGIILLDAARTLRATGLEPGEALLQAGHLRLRPILMTTLCTMTGLLPLALGVGQGSELQRPLAIAVLGGLTLSTAVTLFLLPTALLWCGAVDAGLKVELNQ